MVGDDEVATHNLLLEFFVVGPFKGETAVEHGIEQDPAGLNVHRRTTLLLLEHDLWSHLGRCPTEDAHPLVIGDARRESKVYEFDVVLFVQQDVFQLDISMGDTFTVALTK